MRENWLDDELNKMFDDYDSDMNLEAEWNALQERRQKPKRRSFLLILLFGITIGTASWFMYPSTSITAAVSNSDSIELTADSQENTQTAESLTSLKVEEQNKKKDENKILTINNTYKIDHTPNSTSLSTQSTRSPVVDSDLTFQSSPSSQFIQPSQSKPERSNSTNTSQSSSLSNTETNQKNSEVVLDSESKFINQMIMMPLLLNNLKVDGYQLVHLAYDSRQRTKAKKSSRAGNQFLGLAFGYSPFTEGAILENEKAIDGISSSIYFKKYLAPKLYLATGINLEQYTTQVNGNSQFSYTQLEENQLIERYLNADGTIENVYGVGEVAVTETSTFQLHNRYKFVSVPVIFGVQLYEQAQSHLELEAGMSTTFVSQYEVKYFDGINQFDDYENLDLRQSGIFSGITNLTWHYQPQSMDRLDFFCRLGARVQLNDITNQQVFDIKRFQSFTVGFGAEYRL